MNAHTEQMEEMRQTKTGWKREAKRKKDRYEISLRELERMAQKLRALAALPEDPGSILCTHTLHRFTTDAFFCPLRTPGTQAVHRYTCRQNTHPYT